MESRIIIENINKQFNGTAVFSNINLEIPAQVVAVFIGPNGCGKSTLLHILSGLIMADSGAYQIKNFNPHRFSYMLQDYRSTLMPWLTNLENILLPLRIQKRHKSEIIRKSNLLKQVLNTTYTLQIAW